MEFKLLNPKNENGFIQSIDFNFDELKSELSKNLEKYQNLVFTEDTVKEAKDTRAKLNKFKEAVEGKRKEIKNCCLKPYKDFEAKVKELTGLIDEPIKQIDTQLADFEDKRISAKRQDITDFYNSVIDNLKDILPLEKIFNSKWLNATVKMSAIEKEITETVAKVNGDLQVITGLKLDPDMELQVKDKYIQTLDFSAAMAEKTRLENFKNRLKEQENIKKEQTYAKDIKPAKIDTETTQESDNVISIEQEIYYREFWVKGTKEQLISLGKYLKENNIRYGGIEKCQSQIA